MHYPMQLRISALPDALLLPLQSASGTMRSTRWGSSRGITQITSTHKQNKQTQNITLTHNNDSNRCQNSPYWSSSLMSPSPLFIESGTPDILMLSEIPPPGTTFILVMVFPQVFSSLGTVPGSKASLQQSAVAAVGHSAPDCRPAAAKHAATLRPEQFLRAWRGGPIRSQGQLLCSQ